MINQNVYQSTTKQLIKHQPPIVPSTEPKTIPKLQCCGSGSRSVCFRPLGSGFVIICTDPQPDLSVYKQKSKPWFLIFFISFRYFKSRLMYMYLKKIKSKNFEEKNIFVGILPATDEKARSGSRVGSESIQKCHGSTDNLKGLRSVGYITGT